MKNVIGRILGLTAKSNDLQNQKANLDLTGSNTDNVKFQISLTKILLHSAKTNPNNE
jgi:hypothetical protein